MKRYVLYHQAKDLKKIGCKLTGRKKSINGFTYLEVEFGNERVKTTQDDFVPPAGLTHDNGW